MSPLPTANLPQHSWLLLVVRPLWHRYDTQPTISSICNLTLRMWYSWCRKIQGHFRISKDVLTIWSQIMSANPYYCLKKVVEVQKQSKWRFLDILVEFRVATIRRIKGSVWRMHKTYVSIWVAILNYTSENPRLHVCFDKVKNWPTHKLISGPKFIFTVYKWPHTSRTKGELGYGLKLTHTKTIALALKPLEASMFNYNTYDI
jgi:hypothetical protein